MRYLPALTRGAGAINATITARTPTSFTAQTEVPHDGSMPGCEAALQHRLNEAGLVATAEGLEQFDTDGSPVTVGATEPTSRGQVGEEYQTPYGVAAVARHGYQSDQGGATFCPLDRDARIVVSSTPGSPRSCHTSTPGPAPPGPRWTRRRTTAGPSPAA